MFKIPISAQVRQTLLSKEQEAEDAKYMNDQEDAPIEIDTSELKNQQKTQQQQLLASFLQQNTGFPTGIQIMNVQHGSLPVFPAQVLGQAIPRHQPAVVDRPQPVPPVPIVSEHKEIPKPIVSGVPTVRFSSLVKKPSPAVATVSPPKPETKDAKPDVEAEGDASEIAQDSTLSASNQVSLLENRANLAQEVQRSAGLPVSGADAEEEDDKEEGDVNENEEGDEEDGDENEEGDEEENNGDADGMSNLLSGLLGNGNTDEKADNPFASMIGKLKTQMFSMASNGVPVAPKPPQAELAADDSRRLVLVLTYDSGSIEWMANVPWSKLIREVFVFYPSPDRKQSLKISEEMRKFVPTSIPLHPIIGELDKYSAETQFAGMVYRGIYLKDNKDDHVLFIHNSKYMDAVDKTDAYTPEDWIHYLLPLNEHHRVRRLVPYKHTDAKNDTKDSTIISLNEYYKRTMKGRELPSEGFPICMGNAYSVSLSRLRTQEAFFHHVARNVSFCPDHEERLQVLRWMGTSFDTTNATDNLIVMNDPYVFVPFSQL